MTRSEAKRRLASLLRSALREGQAAARRPKPKSNRALQRKIERALKENKPK